MRDVTVLEERVEDAASVLAAVEENGGKTDVLVVAAAELPNEKATVLVVGSCARVELEVEVRKVGEHGETLAKASSGDSVELAEAAGEVVVAVAAAAAEL